MLALLAVRAVVAKVRVLEVGPVRGSLQYSFDEGNQVNSTTTPAAIPGIVGGATKTAGGYIRYAANGIAAGAGFLRTTLPAG